jgi:hypothetical protein
MGCSNGETLAQPKWDFFHDHLDGGWGRPDGARAVLGRTSQTCFLGMERLDGVQTRLSGILVYQFCLNGLANEIANKALRKNRTLQAFGLPFFPSKRHLHG